VAQEVLKSEISRRGLSIAPKPTPAATIVLDEREAAELWKYAALACPECVFEFDEENAASAAHMALAEAGIESVAVPHQETKFDLRGPRVVVAPEDAERAASILAQPTVERLKGDAEAMMAEEFHEPACPACGAEESVLESVEPANLWRCDVCGEVWMEDENLSK
jgi:rubrerythrin